MFTITARERDGDRPGLTSRQVKELRAGLKKGKTLGEDAVLEVMENICDPESDQGFSCG